MLEGSRQTEHMSGRKGVYSSEFLFMLFRLFFPASVYFVSLSLAVHFISLFRLLRHPSLTLLLLFYVCLVSSQPFLTVFSSVSLQMWTSARCTKQTMDYCVLIFAWTFQARSAAPAPVATSCLQMAGAVRVSNTCVCLCAHKHWFKREKSEVRHYIFKSIMFILRGWMYKAGVPKLLSKQPQMNTMNFQWPQVLTTLHFLLYI